MPLRVGGDTAGVARQVFGGKGRRLPIESGRGKSRRIKSSTVALREMKKYQNKCSWLSCKWVSPSMLLGRMKVDELANELPVNVYALRRLFRAALWTVRLMPTRKCRLLAIYAMRHLPMDVKVKVLAAANMIRITVPHPGYAWPNRRVNKASILIAPRILPFGQIVSQLSMPHQTFPEGVRFQAAAVSALQEAVEAHVVNLFSDANLEAIHVDRLAEDSLVEDMQLALRVR